MLLSALRLVVLLRPFGWARLAPAAAGAAPGIATGLVSFGPVLRDDIREGAKVPRVAAEVPEPQFGLVDNRARAKPRHQAQVEANQRRAGGTAYVHTLRCRTVVVPECTRRTARILGQLRVRL